MGRERSGKKGHGKGESRVYKSFHQHNVGTVSRSFGIPKTFDFCCEITMTDM